MDSRSVSGNNPHCQLLYRLGYCREPACIHPHQLEVTVTVAVTAPSAIPLPA